MVAFRWTAGKIRHISICGLFNLLILKVCHDEFSHQDSAVVYMTIR